MDTVLLSDLERYYLIQGAELGCRTDGRSTNEYRPLELETGQLSHTTGSASVRLGETHILGSVKIEVGKPRMSNPNEGIIELNVECYPTATSGVSDKCFSEIAESLQTVLRLAYCSDVINLEKLCIQPGRQCWIVYIDLLLLEGGGNFLDASSIMVKAALLDATRSMAMRSTNQILASNNDSQDLRGVIPYFDDQFLPVFITVHKLGTSYLVDATKQEEACSLAKLSVSVYPDGKFGMMQEEGCGSCYPETILRMTSLASSIGKELHTAIIQTLKLESELRGEHREKYIPST